MLNGAAFVDSPLCKARMNVYEPAAGARRDCVLSIHHAIEMSMAAVSGVKDGST
jgi:hypothetical protein